uniref:Huntingtin n=1 Tax=Anopheles dirus TaxID=7168 RepID=A0A182NCJ2_9DIPT
MKEDHFGECTSATYFEYFSPMSLSLDQGLKSKLKAIEENFSSDNNEKLSRDLDAILSQSEPGPGASVAGLGSGGTRRRELLVVPKVITTIKNEHRAGTRISAECVDQGEKAYTAMTVSDRKEPEDEQQQLLADVLLFYDSCDPTLRGTVQLIVGNFLRAAIDCAGTYGEFMRTRVQNITTKAFLSENKLLHVVVQSGIIHFLRLFLEKYDPFDYVELWIEYNLTNVLLSLLLEVNATILDLTVHADLLRICSQLITVVLSTRQTHTAADMDAMNKFIIHLLKLLNIYHHLYTNVAPLMMNRSQKADIFMNTKELAQINCFGYFGSDQVYMRLYQQVRSSLESYRISINAEAGRKLFDCLRASIEALWTLLEMKSLSTMTNGMKFVEEVLRYLQSFLSIEPDHCIRCTRYLLRFIFHANYVNRTAEVSFFHRVSQSEDAAGIATEEFFRRYYDFCKAKAKPITSEIGTFVKLFEPLVIACLKIFTKTRSSAQAHILQLLCQLLDFSINYQLLDANSLFVESIVKHVEYIESGTLDDADELMRQVVRFLFQLCGLVREKPLVTVPKIINICDNLLANHVIRRTAIASVQALSHELFLLRLSDNNLAAKVLEAAESNTQKEVVLNMLIKFPDELDVYRTVPMIMYNERLHGAGGEEVLSTNCESDVLTALLQALGDGKLCIRSDRDCTVVLRLIECFGRNQLLESKTVLRFVEIFYTTITNETLETLQKIVYAGLIVGQVFQQTEECYLLHHVGLYLHKAQKGTVEDMPKEEEHDQAQEDDMVQTAAQSLSRMLVYYLRECLNALDVLNLTINISQENVRYSYNAVNRYIGTLTEMTRFGVVSRMLAEQIPLELIRWRVLPVPVVRCLGQMLLSHGFDTELMFSLVRSDVYSVRNDRAVTALVEVLLERKPNETKWTRGEVQALLSGESQLLSVHFQTLLLVHITDDEFAKEIVHAILNNADGQLSCVQCTLLEKAPLTSLSLMCSRLTDLLSAVNIVTSRRAALILDHKLGALVQLGAEGLKDSAVLPVLSDSDFRYLYKTFTTDRRRKFPKLFKTLAQLRRYYESVLGDEELVRPVLPAIDIATLKELPVDDGWFVQQISYHCTEMSYTKPRNIARMMLELKSESKLINLLSRGSFNGRLLRDIVSVAFESMFHAFRTDCVQFNPHLNYLKVHPMLKVALIVLMRRLGETKPDDTTGGLVQCAECVITFMDHLNRLEHLCLFYIDGKFIDRFVKEHLLKSNFFDALLSFGSVCARALEQEETLENVTRVELYLRCIGAIVQQRYLWNELNQNDRYREDGERYITVLYKLLERSFLDAQFFCARRKLPAVFESFVTHGSCSIELYLQAIVVAEFAADSKAMAHNLAIGEQTVCLVESVAVSLLKLDRFYPYALTPIELYECYSSLDLLENGQPKVKCDTIGLKKLHNVQLFIPLSNVFYQPNLERRLLISATDDLHSFDDSSVGTVRFDQHQLSLDYFWEIIERAIDQGGGSNAPPSESLVVRNKRYFVDKINIDTTSSMQLVYDVLKQLLEDDPALVLPHLVNFCEIVENREQIFALNQLLLKLRERVPMEDTLSQQHIIYLLCRLAGLLVPPMADLTHLCTIIPTYLKSTQLYIRNATLQGLLCLLECLVKTNSAIGSMNDELLLLRNVIVNYIVKHGIIEESSGVFSDLHTKLVWTLNFYLIEHTSRFVPDCNLLSNSIISANNILKRTTNLEIYLCILNGLERLVINDRVTRTLHEKIEKLAIDLVKIDNEMFSLSALKLLVTCIYRSCNEQLESTERCNGIVQDEPDIIVQQIDKIEILFAKIRTTTPQGAKVFGDVLCQLIRDLLPPNEILTKVFKELMLNQPNPDIIASVTYQLFRSAIDASYLALLQEWLLCSLPNFLSFPQVNKSVWCLTVIFLSASLNQHLIKLLPEVLSLPSYQQLNEREINNFIISAKDFYSRLEPNGSQRVKFREIFRQHDSFVFQSLLQCL